MHTKSIVVFDIIALLLTGTWIIYNAIKGMSVTEILYNYLYSSVVLVAFILTLYDQATD